MTRTELPRASDTIDVAALHRALEAAISGEVRFDRLSRGLYASDASVFQIVPVGVVLPKAEQDIVRTREICARFGVSLTARGGGTSQAGQCIGAGVILDFSKYFDRVLEINSQEKWARVEPGVVLDDLNRQAKPHGLHFAPDISTSSRATIGGMIANNSSGTHSVIHGKTIDHVLGVRAMLSDGSIIHAAPVDSATFDARCSQQNLEGACYRVIQQLAHEHADEIERRFPKILRRVGGYNLDLFTTSSARPFDLSRMLVGSEGTLALTLEAKVKLIDLPRARASAVLHFDDLLDALALTPRILEHGPAAVEVLDKYILDSTLLNAEAMRLRSFLHGTPGAILLVEFYADDATLLPAKLAELERDLRAARFLGHIHVAVDGPGQDKIWKLRKFALGLSMAEKGDAKAISFVEDTAVAPARLRDFIAEFLDCLRRHDTAAGVYAHASVGCLHVRPIINMKTAAGVDKFAAIAEQVADLVLKYGGALSGEHGDGLVRSPFMAKMFGPQLYAAFRTLKKTFDPHGLFNPGKIIDAPPLTQNLRFGPAYVTPEVATTFDFSAEGGITRAAELCAGVGECRKKRQGTMCPSYQATCEEMHSTRGRGNALRLALTGQLGFTGLSDPALKEALDLCLECKACKSECPTNVDMARLKAEFLHQYHRKHGLPWRPWLFGKVGDFARRGQVAPWLFNALTRGSMGRWLNDRLFGIDARRLPPALAASSWSLKVKGTSTPRGERSDPPGSGDVMLFADTFMNYFEPDLGDHAQTILSQLGYTVTPAVRQEAGANHVVCCGRPLISNGMLDDAVRCAEHNVTRMFPWALAGGVITACEPSCILTIKDDYPALLRGDLLDKARVVANSCKTIEELVAPRLADAKLSSDTCGRILVQAHCHQRSLIGMGALLKSLPGKEIVDLDAGCCGLAGSFGYEKEHYDISRLVGEQRLFPALRRAKAGDVVVAPGFSCRLQIRHFTGMTAIHPAGYLARVLGKR